MLLTLAQAACPMVARLSRHDRKIHRLAEGQMHVMRDVETCFSTIGRQPVTWVHASSLGEFNILRPVVARLKEQTGHFIVLTFFSPTGVDAMAKRQELPYGVDKVFYLPIDTHRNVRRFLDAVKPERAVFAVAEYWVNYLQELHRREVPVYLVSAVVSEKSAINKWYGQRFYGKVLNSYRMIMTVDDGSRQRMMHLGVKNVQTVDDPLFDTALKVASEPYSDGVVERFIDGRPTFVAGSLHNDRDLDLVASLANSHADVKFIVAPHEITPAVLDRIENIFRGRVARHSQFDDSNNRAAAEAQVLVIDFVGALSRLYRYGQWAYVGGGFTPYVHSVIEATAYGLPACFGPCIHRKPQLREMLSSGIGAIVSCEEEINTWFERLKTDSELLARLHEEAIAYMRSKGGATQKVVDIITGRATNSLQTPNNKQ